MKSPKKEKEIKISEYGNSIPISNKEAKAFKKDLKAMKAYKKLRSKQIDQIILGLPLTDEHGNVITIPDKYNED